MRLVDEALFSTLMAKVYPYLGLKELLDWGQEPPYRTCVQSPQDVLRWIRESEQRLGMGSSVVATFIIDVNGQLWIADRHSEHVVCARGQDVLSAGEMTFAVGKQGAEVVAVTNQSTGYCPEPDSWPSVSAVLDRAALPHPAGFTGEFIFRRCDTCGTKNVVKEGWFECGVCQSPLSREWNFVKGPNA